MPALPVPPASFEEVLAQAYADRPDFLAAQARVREAEAAVKARAGERWPSASLWSATTASSA